MNQSFIAVIDSGIGGLTVLSELVDYFPNESFLYYGDNDNAPYGNKTEQELKTLALNIINYISEYDLKLIVVACNTLSVTTIKEIEKMTSVPVVGIYPPVDSMAMYNGKTLLLATTRTAERYRSKNDVDSVGLLSLAEYIEKNVFNLATVEVIRKIVYDHVGRLSTTPKYYDNIILGCTHYIFVEKIVFDHFCPLAIFNGVKNLLNAVNKKLSTRKSLEKHYRKEIFFIGKNGEYNKKVFLWYKYFIKKN